MKELNKFINDYGWFGFIRFALYPISLFVITPIRLIQSLAASLILLKGGWKHYPHFDLTAGIVANFSGTPTLISEGGTVDFTDLSTCAPTSWSWSFPGSVQGSSTSQNPTLIQYNTAGNYDVSLTATNASSSDGETKVS